jgi:hypothetical protein
MSAGTTKETKTMSTQKRTPRLQVARLALSAALLALGAWLMAPRPASAAELKPAWKISAYATPSNLSSESKSPSFSANGQILIVATNIGGAATNATEPTTITDTLPAGITPVGFSPPDSPCEITGQTVTCNYTETVRSGHELEPAIDVEVSPLAKSGLPSTVSASGGGAVPSSATIPIVVSKATTPFDFLPGDIGFSAPLSGSDGAVATQAGSHPQQLTVDVGFTGVETPGGLLVSGDPLRDVTVDLPRGVVVNPRATPKLCTESQFEASSGGEVSCPPSSQIGVVSTMVGVLTPSATTAPLFNMVPPPGTPSMFGFEVGGVGIFVHIVGGVRSDGDYGLSGSVNDVLARGLNPVFGARVQFWGDPADSTHDYARGNGCFYESECPVVSDEPGDAFLTTPVECSGEPTTYGARADSWEHPTDVKHAAYQSADLAGTQVSLDGCNELKFQPTIEAKPTTNLADSPSGLDVTVHQPQNLDPKSLSPAIMRDISLTLPEGMAVNPSSADGLGVCDQADAHVNTKSAASCPDASKLGTIEASTPLVDHPIEGFLYLARPYQNPFGSLLALYLALDDPETGVVSNLAGKVIADPATGQLTTVFEENPQLPIEDIKAHLFTGPRASLRTPQTCATYTSKATMTPWSTPQTPDAIATDSFAIQASPTGGACPASQNALLNNPSFIAGTLAPKAGAYSPFVLKLTRPDGSQPLAKIDTTLAPGLVGRLAGTPYCPEAAIAQAMSRNKPNEGAIEKASPSCPASSQVGTIDVGAGAGITPLYVQGNAYLAGPYQGAPLSLVTITPAVAGPFDLGAVVVRAALRLDPETAVVKATSDPLPQILEGIPLDVRSISLRMDKPDFTLNPTSCNPASIDASVLSALGASASLSSPFQVGGCSELAFKPKIAIRLKGATKRTGHPALTATASFKAGQANTRFVQVTLPRSEFLDQAHIGTVCTRVQFAADQCPAASVYGKASATSPLLDEPLSGPVYLRSSSHELPDLVIALDGQVDVDLAGRIDSVKGGIRTTFEATPDAPVTKFTLQMQGGRKGLLINSANLCKLKPSQAKATILMEGQNGKVNDFNPAVKSACKAKARKGKKKKHKGGK